VPGDTEPELGGPADRLASSWMAKCRARGVTLGIGMAIESVDRNWMKLHPWPAVNHACVAAMLRVLSRIEVRDRDVGERGDLSSPTKS